MDPTQKADYAKLLLSLIPESGASIGNVSLRETLREKLREVGQLGEDAITDSDYWSLRDSLIDEGLIAQGRGRGGSVHRVVAPPSPILSAPIPAADVIPPESPKQRISESALYEPFLIQRYAQQQHITHDEAALRLIEKGLAVEKPVLKMLGRSYLGIELDEKYHALARQT
jgi:hypothetical protein